MFFSSIRQLYGALCFQPRLGFNFLRGTHAGCYESGDEHNQKAAVTTGAATKIVALFAASA
jgi:hypothetical protein